MDRIAGAGRARHHDGLERRRHADGRVHLRRLVVRLDDHVRAGRAFRWPRAQRRYVGHAVVVELRALERQLLEHRAARRCGAHLLLRHQLSADTTLSRREFLAAAAAGTAMFACAPGPSAAQTARYDLIIRGGRVIDPSVRLDAVRDVAIAAGRIAAVDAGITADATETIDARGKLVVPGLTDIHTHAARTADGPPLMLQDGVTAWIDAGSQGADHVADTVAVARSSAQPGRVLINIGRAGILPDGDTMDLKRADVAAARDAIAKNRDFIVGVKARLSRDVAGANDYEVLRRAQEVASRFGLPVMIHMGQTISPIPRLFDLLKRGDIVTHMFAPPPNSIVDESGHIQPAVLAARRRGVWFDVANGQNGHL